MMSQNELYPIFLKLDQLRMLIVGGGEVGHEKLHFILKSSPNARIKIVAPWIAQETLALIDRYPDTIEYIAKAFEPDDVVACDIVVAATNIPTVNIQVWEAAQRHRKIVNVADTPALCQFYMGSIVTKGDVKVAISTNGKSPTFAKRFRQWLEAVLPDETSELVDKLKVFRDRLSEDFNGKVRELNRITEKLVANE
jgi:siroheme synthase-like protein